MGRWYERISQASTNQRTSPKKGADSFLLPLPGYALRGGEGTEEFASAELEDSTPEPRESRAVTK